MGKNMGLWNNAIQTRTSFTSHVLNQMKGVKLAGLDARLAKDVQNLRVHELNLSKKFRMLIVWMNLVGT